jgi:uncharacterized protein (TIGR02145 family)
MVIMKKMNIMKVIKKLSNATYTVAAIALLAMPVLSSCEKSETPTNGEEGNIITLSATSELPDTKTSLGESNVVNWTTGDKISTFWGDNTTAAEFTLSTGDGTTSATFTGTPPAGATETCYAIYPHNAATTIDAAKTISFTLPATQSYNANGFAEGANPMVAYKTATGTLQFKNLCAVLKLQLKVAEGTQTIKKITISSATKKLSGAATVAMTYGSGVPTISMATDATANNYVELTLGDGVELNTTAKAFYIVVPATASGETDNSFKITIESTTGGEIKSAQSSDGNRFNRAKIVSMPSFDYADAHYLDGGTSGTDRGAGIVIGTTIWAPVNCGYAPYASASDKGYPYGKLYQWGRKYGQGYDANDATYPSGDNLVTGPVDLAVGQDAANAAKFYMNSTSPSDWLTPEDGNLWNTGSESSPMRTDYDPCPTGWRVPTNVELTALFGGKTAHSLVTHNDQKGAWFNGTSSPGTSGVFLPAAGFRNLSGIAYNRSSHADYWSSTPNDARSYLLYFYSDDTYIRKSGNNAYGYSVRCVKE